MALNPNQKFIAAGSWVKVEYQDTSGNWNRLGLVTKASYQEDFHVLPAKVLGFLGPISYDSQDYSCQISIGAFIPEIPNNADVAAAAGGAPLNDMLPTRSDVQKLGKGKTFQALRFLNTGPEQTAGQDVIIAQFSYVIVASDNADLQPGQYLMNNITLYAVERIDPSAMMVAAGS